MKLDLYLPEQQVVVAAKREELRVYSSAKIGKLALNVRATAAGRRVSRKLKSSLSMKAPHEDLKSYI